jgi:uncharacterized protein (DUF427 family)
VKAIWNGTVIAESDQTIVIEGNQYFPPDSVHREYLMDSDTQTTCIWKGVANYYTLMVEGQENADAAWYYAEPKAGSIEKVGHDFTNYVAFWRGVEVHE